MIRYSSATSASDAADPIVFTSDGFTETSQDAIPTNNMFQFVEFKEDVASTDQIVPLHLLNKFNHIKEWEPTNITKKIPSQDCRGALKDKKLAGFCGWPMNIDHKISPRRIWRGRFPGEDGVLQPNYEWSEKDDAIVATH